MLIGPLPNVWLGVSVEDQATADERIPLLWDTTACLRFISYEPALGPVDIRPWLRNGSINWVIAGGESGPRARPCALEWLEGMVQQCRDSGTAVFVKQLGAFVVSELRAYDTDDEAKRNGFDSRWLWRAGLAQGNSKGGDLTQFTPELNIRMFPGDPWAPVVEPENSDDECVF